MIATFNQDTREVTILDRHLTAIGHCRETKPGAWDYYRDPWHSGELSTEQVQFIEGELAILNR